MKGKKLFLILFLFLVPQLCIALEGYHVRIVGVEDPETERLLRAASQLAALQENPPATSAGLRRRAETDLPNLVRALHSRARYNARIELEFDFTEEIPIVTLIVDEGPVYPLESFDIVPAVEKEGFPYEALSPESLGICLGSPATPKMIIKGEEALLNRMECWGYPFASIVSSEVEADQKSFTVHVALYLDPGPKIAFGNTNIVGNHKTRDRFIYKKICWRRGQIYSPSKIERTRRALENSGLFSSVIIEHPDEAPDGTELPMTIHLHEAKARTLGFGVNVSTLRGPGVSAEWEHRNLHGMGDRLSFRTALWTSESRGRLSYLIPDVGRPGRDLVFSADYRREKTQGYTANAFTLSSMVETKCSRCLKTAYGLRYKHLLDTNIHETYCYSPARDPEEKFNIFKAPLMARWNDTGSIFDPRCGTIAELNVTPSYQFTGNNFVYNITTFEFSAYVPLSRRITAAGKINLGSIVGPNKITIPRSELFDAGTDQLLRGYAYKTVSPLDNQFKPTGGRSLMIYSFELRYRMNCEYGWVLFYDLGNVYAQSFPPIGEPFLHSVGVGFRYFTPIAPIRFDIAVPITIREVIDKQRVQFYLNIGQSF